MRLPLLLIVSILCAQGWGQSLRVGFYNVENLFDTINQINLEDGDFTPQGSRRWDTAKYFAKLDRLAQAVELFSPDILGLCEVENREVVVDFASHTARLRGVVHYDSHDGRGIDVALIYDTTKLKVISSEPIFIKPTRRNLLKVVLRDNMQRPLTVFVAHLPSKLRGAKAEIQRQTVLNALDSLTRGLARVVVVGDFNDSPRAVGVMYNCAIAPFKEGKGSYAYRDVWDMIDQIWVSRDLLALTDGVQRVVAHRSLITAKGRFAGYPLKMSVSDHLPVYVDFEAVVAP